MVIFKNTCFVIFIQMIFLVVNSKFISIGEIITSENANEDVFAVCDMVSAKTHEKVGVVEMHQHENILTFKGSIRGLLKNAEVGFHVHEYANFSNLENMCNSAGEHFNPFNAPNVACNKNDVVGSVGRLGNVPTDAVGNSNFTFASIRASLRPGPTYIIGRSLIVHMGAYICGLDGSFVRFHNPTLRVACGKIKRVTSKQ